MDQRHAEILPETEKALRDLLPFMEASHGDALLSCVEGEPVRRLLSRFYLFEVSSAVLPDGVDDIQRFIEQRYRTVLSAAHRAGWTVLTAAVGSKSGISLHLGFLSESGIDESDPSYVFERTLRGMLPGLDLHYKEMSTVESFVIGKDYGGLIAGIPTLKIEDERQHFSLPAILRGMQGEKYALILMSRPVSEAELHAQLRAVWQVRDICHELSRSTHQREGGESSSWHEGTTMGAADSKTTTSSPHLLRRVKSSILGGTLSDSAQATLTEGRTTGTTSERHWSESLSQEVQNSVPLYLERLAEYHGDRLLKSANVGAWETSVTFATATAPGRDILAGLLIGELAKPSTDAIPPSVYYADLGDDRPLLLPRQDNVSKVFPSSLASYLTSEELASIAAPPSENLPGYEIRRTPALSLTDVHSATAGEGRSLGNVCDHGRPLEGVEVHLGPTDLAKHLFVCGLTGTGKTTTVKEILAAADVPFLVLESAKRDYRRLLGCPSLEGRLRIYTPGDTSIAPLRLNPFHIMPGVQAGVHIDYLKAIFNASFSLYGPMPYIVEKCLHNIYLKRGWDLTVGKHPQLLDLGGQPDKQRYDEEESRCYFPTLLDLRDEVQEYVKLKLDYKGELSDNIRTAIVTRLDSLAVGSKGLMFNSSEPLDIENLLAHPTVLELEALSDDDDKAFVVGLLLTLISEYRQTNDPSRDPYAEPGRGLQHVLVIEEAHRLLKNIVQERQTEHLGNPRGKAVEFFANVISEMRSMGQGVTVVEQIPSKLLPDVIKNTNAKIVHRLVSHDDQVLLASTLGLEEKEAIYFTSLRTGHALYAKEGMQRPIEVKVKIDQTFPDRKVSDSKVRRDMRPRLAADADDEADAMAVRHAMSPYGNALVLRLLCTLACGESSEPSVYVQKAVAHTTALLRQRDHKTSDPAIKRFLITGIVDLLANGHFRLADGEIWGITPLIARLLDGDDQAGASFRKWLAKGWQTDARDGAIQRIRELACGQVLRARTPPDDAAVNRIVAAYFITDLPAIRCEIAGQVRRRIEGSTWTP